MKNDLITSRAKNGFLLAVPLVFFFLLITAIPTVHAETTIQMSDQNVIQGQVFLVYRVIESGLMYIGVYNTTDQLILTDGQYVFVLKPSTIDYLHNPLALFDLFMNSVPAQLALLEAVAIIALVFVIVRWVGGRR